MTKNVKIWIAVAALVVLVGILFFMDGGFQGISTAGNTSLRTLLSSNVSQKCSFDNGQTNGTIYVSGGKMRGDFTAKSGESSVQSHMIITNDIAYVWLDNSLQGYRMPFENIKSGSSGNSQGGVDADAKVATNCNAWQGNDASFVLPGNVSFTAVATSTQ